MLVDRSAADRSSVLLTLWMWNSIWDLSNAGLRDAGFTEVAIGKLRALRRRLASAEAVNELRPVRLTEEELLYETFRGPKLEAALRLRGEVGVIDVLLALAGERAS